MTVSADCAGFVVNGTSSFHGTGDETKMDLIVSPFPAYHNLVFSKDFCVRVMFSLNICSVLNPWSMTG